MVQDQVYSPWTGSKLKWTGSKLKWTKHQKYHRLHTNSPKQSFNDLDLDGYRAQDSLPDNPCAG